jgi:RHS repeat-associated protein
MRVAAPTFLLRIAVIVSLAIFCGLATTSGTAEAYKLPPDTSGELFTPDVSTDITMIRWAWYPAGSLTSWGIGEQAWVLQWTYQLSACCYTSWLDMTGCPPPPPDWWWPDMCSGSGGGATERPKNLTANAQLGVGSDVPGRLAWKPGCYQDRDLVTMGCYIRWYPVSDATKPPPGRWGRCVRSASGQLFGEEGHMRNPSGCLSDPVNTATGSYVTAESDISLPGIGLPFELTRTYNSSDPTEGQLGRGWTHSYAPKLTLNQSEAVLRAENGAVVHFYRRPGGGFEGEPGALSKLVTVAGGYELIRKDQVRYAFNSSGRLTSLRDRNGNDLTLEYAGDALTEIVDTAGREITFEHGSDAKLDRIVLPDGRDVEYAYTGALLTAVTDLAGKTTEYEYDTEGRLTKTISPEGRTKIENRYGTDGRVVEQIDGLGKSSTFSWNPTTMTATMTDARGKVWTDVYDPYFVLERRIDPLGNETEFEYDADLNSIAVTDPRGHTTTSAYDERGNLLTRTAPAPLSYIETFTYDSENNVLTATDGRGKTTDYDYDTAGNLVETTQPDPDGAGPASRPVTTYGREAGTGLLSSIEDARGKTTELAYDEDGNVTRVTTPLGFKTTMTYDGSGRMTKRVEPRGNVAGADPDDYRTAFSYTGVDQLLTVTDPLGHVTSREYDDDRNLVELTDAKNRVTAYEFDAANQLVQVTAPDLTSTTYDYDDAGNLIERTDAKNHTTNYSYDDANRLAKITSPLGKEWTYDHDAAGNVIEVVDANGKATPLDPSDGTTAFAYDELGRLTTVAYSDATPDVSYTYDANSNRTAMTDGAGTASYAYDALNRLTSVTRGADVFSYGYDAIGNVTSRTYPDSTAVSHGFDDDGRMETVTSGGETTTYGYDPAGNLVSTALPSGTGITSTRAYDAAGRIGELTNSRNTTVLSSFEYTLDEVGNPTEITTASGPRTFAYDELDRLNEVCYQASCPGASDPFIRWAYDDVGNRTSEERPSGTTSYSYDAADRLTQTTGLGGTVNFGYDENGNQTSAGAKSFTYNLAGRLSTATVAGTTTTYGYDGEGTRLQASSGGSATNYLWDANNRLPEVVLERDGAGTLLRRYVHGLAPISLTPGGSASPSYYTADVLGSIVAVHSNGGADQWAYDYEPFGAEKTTTQLDSGAPPNWFRFTGELLDSDAGLYHLRVRQYDPTLGRFTATDPLPPAKRSPFVSAYVYVGDRPTTLIDPSGLRAESDYCASMSCWVRGGAGIDTAWDTALQTIQTALYGTYYASYNALAYSNYMPLGLRAQLVGAEAVGLAGDAGIDLLRGNSIANDARDDSVLPNYISDRWDPPWLRTYLPGIGRDEFGNTKVDFRW